MPNTCPGSKIRNFRNFSALDVALAGNIVVVGENRVGKSNLLRDLLPLEDARSDVTCALRGLVQAAGEWEGPRYARRHAP